MPDDFTNLLTAYCAKQLQIDHLFQDILFHIYFRI
jgi:hypothetical protein